MQLNVTYTPGDLAEALAPMRQRSRAGAVPLVIIGIAVVLLLMLFTLLYVLSQAAGVGNLPPPLFSPPPQDLLLTLLPSLAPALIIPMMIAIVLLRATRRGARRPRIALALLNAAIVALIILPLWPVLNPQPLVLWRPSRLQLVFVGMAPWILSLFLCIAILLIWRRRQLKSRWQLTPSLHRPRTIELSHEHGMHIRDDVLEYSLTWRFFQSARETPNLLLLIGEDARVYMLPKRHFAGPEDLALAKAMIRQYVDRAQFTHDDAAFPVLPVASH